MLATIENRGAAADTPIEPFEAVEFELALDLQDATVIPFADCVANAAQVVGAEILFDMPADGTIEDAVRIAAVRMSGDKAGRILFAILNEDGMTVRMASRAEVGERFHGFATAFIGVLERIRSDLPQGLGNPVGTA
jgi:hypothetical protein